MASTAQDVADVIPRRALDTDGLGRGTFTEQTVPTKAQVERIALGFDAEVLALVPDLPESLRPQAVRVAAIGTAAQIELAFFPESSGTTYAQLQERYENALAALSHAVEIVTGKDQAGNDGAGGGAVGVVAAPLHSFPDVDAVVVAEFAERPYYSPYA